MSAISWTTFEDAIHTWVTGGSLLDERKIIWAYQGGVRPEGPYIELTVASTRGVGQDWTKHRPVALSFADLTVTADPITDRLTHVAHGLATGDGPLQLTTTGVTPGNSAVVTNYWAIRDSADTLRIAETFYQAMTGDALDLGDAGTGTLKVVSTANTVRHGRELEKVVQGHRVATLNLQCFGLEQRGQDPAINPMPILEDVMSSLPLYYYSLDQAGVGVGNVDPVNLAGGTRNSMLEPRATSSVELHLAAELVAYETYIEYMQMRLTVKNPAGATLAVADTWVPEDPTP